MIIFLDIPKTDSVRHDGHVLKTMKITKCPARSTTESTSNQEQCLKSLGISKEAFYIFRGIKSENSLKWNKFKTIMYLPLSKHFPAAWSLPQNTAYFAFFPDFSHLFSDADHFFWDPWVPLTFSPAATLVVYHIPIKIRETNNVVTQHSVNAHTKPLSEKQNLSESCGGSILDPRSPIPDSSILDPRSSILDPRSSILLFQFFSLRLFFFSTTEYITCSKEVIRGPTRSGKAWYGISIPWTLKSYK